MITYRKISHSQRTAELEAIRRESRSKLVVTESHLTRTNRTSTRLGLDTELMCDVLRNAGMERFASHVTD